MYNTVGQVILLTNHAVSKTTSVRALAFFEILCCSPSDKRWRKSLLSGQNIWSEHSANLNANVRRLKYSVNDVVSFDNFSGAVFDPQCLGLELLCCHMIQWHDLQHVCAKQKHHTAIYWCCVIPAGDRVFTGKAGRYIEQGEWRRNQVGYIADDFLNVGIQQHSRPGEYNRIAFCHSVSFFINV